MSYVKVEEEWTVKVMKWCTTNIMSSRGEGMEYKVIERVKCSSLRWFGHRENGSD